VSQVPRIVRTLAGIHEKSGTNVCHALPSRVLEFSQVEFGLAYELTHEFNDYSALLNVFVDPQSGFVFDIDHHTR
jgi:hypothetical protein